ncbi:Fatty acid desaturase, type 1 domain-containing protein [Aphelenchoides besseyi]|nr:Fatty acid desaturase, type 1 domain-containing protein [Aphelenchoides besseyi]
MPITVATVAFGLVDDYNNFKKATNGNGDAHQKSTYAIENEVTAMKKPTEMYPTYEEVRKAIPPQCFEKNLGLSLFYLVWDYVVIAALYLAVPYVEKYAGWPGFFLSYVIGMFGFALFVVGHDCGHTTFSQYQWVNDVCGHLAHAPLLVPGKKVIDNIINIPDTWRKIVGMRGLPKNVTTNWISFVGISVSSQLPDCFCGKDTQCSVSCWHHSGQPIINFKGLPDGSHFYPFSSLFTTRRERIQCAISSLCCLASAYIAFVLCDYDFVRWLKYYEVPLMFFGLWLVMVTYLQHSHEETKVYEEGHWTFVKGQSETIDRKYGFGIDKLTHHITDCHVAHHFFFTKIPHYHLPAATEAVKKVLSRYPGCYKSVSTYDHLLEFLRLNVKLDYMVGKGTGLLKYRTNVGKTVKQN